LTRASIHFRKKMDCRVKPGNDRDRFNLNEKCSNRCHPGRGGRSGDVYLGGEGTADE
jgi:hypothetical protein